MVGIGVVRFLSPDQTGWAPPAVFGAALLLALVLGWRSVFDRRAFGLRRADLTRTRGDRVLLGLAGAYVLMMSFVLTTFHTSIVDGSDHGTPFWLFLMVFVLGVAMLCESGRTPRG